MISEIRFVRCFVVFLFAFFVQKIYSQELIQINKDHYFFNGVFYNGEIILSSTEGFFKYEDFQLKPFNENLTGGFDYIKIRDNQIVKGEFLPSNYLDPVLPEEYKNIEYSTLFVENFILTFVRGDLLVFEQPLFSRTKINKDVTGITHGYYSTIEGVLNDQLKLQENLPGVEKGKIRSITDGLAICWGGLHIQYKGDVYDFSDQIEYFKVGDQLLGRARDIIELTSAKYLVTSSKGVYIIDINKERVFPLLDNTGNLPAKIKKLDSNNYLISLGKELYLFNAKSNDVEKYYTHNEIIIDYYVDKKNEIFYILDANGLKEISKNSDQRFTLIQKNYKNESTLVNFQNILLIIQESSIDGFDLSSSRTYFKLYRNLFNPQSYYLEKDILKIGSNDGVIEISSNNLRSATFINNYIESKAVKTNNTFMVVLITVMMLIIIYLILLVSRKRRLEKKIISQATDFSLEEKIKKYISYNLSTVTVDKIKDEFNLTNIYEVFSEETPGEFIRTQRIKKVKKMRKERVSEEEIAKATGFSVSYLKKI